MAKFCAFVFSLTFCLLGVAWILCIARMLAEAWKEVIPWVERIPNPGVVGFLFLPTLMILWAVTARKIVQHFQTVQEEKPRKVIIGVYR